MIDSLVLSMANRSKEFIADMFGHSQKGHAEYTSRAIKEFEPDTTYFAEKLLSIASQSPDLYEWNGHLFHAHTNEYDPNAQINAIENSKEAFLGLLKQTISFVDLYSANHKPKALYYLGIAVHLIQDLVYHRGMTLTQHAILQFGEKKNPDIPNQKKTADARETEAINATKILFRTVRNKLGSVAWDNMVKVKGGKPKTAAKSLARTIYRKEQDMTLGSLWDYKQLGNKKIYGDLSNFEWSTECDESVAVACWNVQSMLAEILK